MTTMMRPLASAAGLATVLALSTGALAHGGGGGGPDPRGVGLHVGSDYESCWFNLHPELTAEQFREFAVEAGQIGQFRQVSAADTLGAGAFDVNIAYAYFFLNDAKGAWNNTMSHPQSDHYLGEQLGMPYLTVRVGVTDAVDAELYGTANVESNYGLVGIASKIGIFREERGAPVSFAVRPSVSGLIGPSEVQVWNASVDLSVSRRFYGIAPFAGLSLSSSLAVDLSTDTDVGHQGEGRPIGFAGVDYNWRFITVALRGEISNLPALALRAGGRF